MEQCPVPLHLEGGRGGIITSGSLLFLAADLLPPGHGSSDCSLNAVRRIYANEITVYRAQILRTARYQRDCVEKWTAKD